MRIKRSFQIYLFFLIAAAFGSCKNKKEVDVSNIELDLKIERFDKDLAKVNSANLVEKVPSLQKKYGAFYDDFMSGMLGVGNTSDTTYFKNLRTVINNTDYRALQGSVAEKFNDLSSTEEELRDAFKHVKYYFPGQKIPRVISFFSGFAVQVPVGDNYIGIGLDMFLGADSKFYPALRESIPLYISRRFTPDNITPRVIEAFVREDMFPEPDTDHSFLDRMIYNGKILFLMSSFMPGVPDSTIIGYTSDQQKWIETYEADVWGYFLQENLLYETDYMKVQKYLSEAPFTPGLGTGNESAPKLGLFTGWQIVKNYMERNPNVTLQQLMADTKYQEILNRSHYKPK
ncbi:gliding motility lipoprotein GldB [Arcticibacter tournemirensis]|uniref:Gliding motility lipoprotein GldB n=1 Tax=Arcticibacter tournemirensis TaxID=699437 RepID=A0A4Q0M2V3_9SPHI|nr:gliding motility lipoprotein GldB [Arcticibacter tournemirensis]RXF67125.1 gliding motility lipoprotein GldB [Arcticibacter tournemirensis]